MKKALLLMVILIFCGTKAFSGTCWVDGVGSAVDSGTNVVFDDGNGFESPWSPTSNAGNWDSFTGTPVSEGTIVKNGTVSMECTGTGQYMEYAFSTQTEIWVDFWYYPENGNYYSTLVKFTDADGDYTDIVVRWHAAEDDLAVYDSGTNWSSGVGLTVDTWTHIFVHLIFNGSSSTVQAGFSTDDYWDAWDLNQTSVTLVGTDAKDIKFGNVYQTTGELEYYDTLRVFNGSTMPTEWESP